MTDALRGSRGRAPRGGWIGGLAAACAVAACGWVACGADAPAPGSARVGASGIRFVHVPGGEFEMGSPAGETGRHGDEAVRRVRIARGFFMGATEVTQAEWAKVMGGYNPSRARGAGLPVTGMTWEEATRFCKLLSAIEGRAVRLPTEAEWERACRAGCGGAFSGGAPDDVAWHAGNSGDALHPVGLKGTNAWGLCDMHGNAMEWCADWYEERPATVPGGGAVVDPRGPARGEARVARGGSFRHALRAARCAARHGIAPSYQFEHLGLRVVMEDEAKGGSR